MKNCLLLMVLVSVGLLYIPTTMAQVYTQAPNSNQLMGAIALTNHECPITMTHQPADLELCAEETGFFTIGADGVGLTYQWQISYDKDTSWRNIDAATNYLYMMPLSSVDEKNRYRCIVRSSCGASITSQTAKVKIYKRPVVITQPVSILGCSKLAATFKVGAANADSYQWYVNNTEIPGATGAVCTINDINAADIGYYSVVLRNGPGCETKSDDAYLDVYRSKVLSVSISADRDSLSGVGTNVTYTAHPAMTSSAWVKKLTLKLDADTSVCTYQWKKNDVDIANATAATYTYAPSDGDTISVVITTHETCVSGSPALSNKLTIPRINHYEIVVRQ